MDRPTPFDRARAEAIWAQRGPQHSLANSDMTPGERLYVSQIWNTMPGTTCWMDAFFRILHDRV